VVRDADDEVAGCHPTEEAADRQVAALYAQAESLLSLGVGIVEKLGGDPSPGTSPDKRLKENQPCSSDHKMVKGKCVPKWQTYAIETADTDELLPIKPWHGIILTEGSETGDGREFAVDSLTWEDPTTSLILLSWQPKDLPQHEEAVTVGRVNHIERVHKDDGTADIHAWGVLDLGSDNGREVVRLTKGGYAGGLSADIDSVQKVELVFPDETLDDAPTDVGDGTVPKFILGAPEKRVFHGGRIRGVTMCRLPALVEGRLQLIDEDEALSVPLAAAGDPLALIDDGTEPYESDPENIVQDRDALTSAGVPVYPPSDWFTDPKLPQATPFTITDDGQVFGHLALWGTCHTTFPNRCITPPKERDHAYFLRHELRTREDESVAVGTITFGTGHASTTLGAVPAAAHYDNTGLAACDINVGEDAHGIWVAGAVRPNVDEERLRELRGASLSGDWRVIAGKLRLVAVLGVNVPGFPIPRMRVAASTEEGPWTALVAAGVATEERVEASTQPYPPGTLVIRRVEASVAAETFIGNGNNQYTKGRGGSSARAKSGGAKSTGGGGGGGGDGGGAGTKKRGIQGPPGGHQGHGSESAQMMIFKKRGDYDKAHPDGRLSASKNAADLVKDGKSHGAAIESVGKDRGISLKTRESNGKTHVDTGDGEANLGTYDKKTDMGTVYTSTVPFEVKGYKNFVNETVHHPWNMDQNATVLPPEE